jgi:hypothetical protein
MARLVLTRLVLTAGAVDPLCGQAVPADALLVPSCLPICLPIHPSALPPTFWKGLERSVSTVPGCSRMAATRCLRRSNSRLMHLVSWLTAALLAR